MAEDNSSYTVWAGITAVIVCGGIWLYAMFQWGFLLGLIFGWIPALIGGFVSFFIAPIIWIGVLILGLIILTTL